MPPPYTIATAVPASSDLISIYPGIEQTYRGTVLDWLTFISDPTTGIIKTSALPPAALASAGYLNGLTLSNNGANALNIASGTAATSNGTVFGMTLVAALTAKSIAAGWAVGSSTGGLDTGTVTNGLSYHVYLIARSDTGVVDVCYSLSATNPTIGVNIPAAYDRWRRIGSLLYTAGAIPAFRQIGDTFKYVTGVVDLNNSPSPFAVALRNLSVPSGIQVQPVLNLSMSLGSNGLYTLNFADAADAASEAFAVLIDTAGTSGNSVAEWVNGGFYTNTSAQLQIGFIAVVTGALPTATIITKGWIDTRGRL